MPNEAHEQAFIESSPTAPPSDLFTLEQLRVEFFGAVRPGEIRRARHPNGIRGPRERARPDAYRHAAAVALKKWPADKKVTRAEYEQALKDLDAVKMG